MAYWLQPTTPLHLAIAPRPRGNDWLELDLRALKHEGVNILVSLLTPEESDELGLADEAQLAAEAGLDLLTFPIPDRQTPANTQAFRTFATELLQQARQGKKVAAHCRAGIGRSSLLIASVLVLNGTPAEEAFHRISQARGLEVPDTPEQVNFVRALNPVP